MLYVVRHGQTGWNEKKKTMGRMDMPLSNVGIEQSEQLKEELEGTNIDLIFCSPLTRAKETANIINKSKKVTMELDSRLMERSLGNLEGRDYTEDNDRLWDININTDDYYIEKMEDMKDRVYDFLEDVINNYSDKDVLVVTHGGVTALFNCYFNDTLYDGPISNKFLESGKVISYDLDTYKNKDSKKYIYKPEEKKKD